MANYTRGYLLTETEVSELAPDDVVLALFKESGVEVVAQKRNLDMSLGWAIRTNMINFYTVFIPDTTRQVDMTPRVDMFADYPPIDLEDEG